jgi:endoglucanase
MYTFHFYAATHRQDLRSRLGKTVDLGLPVFVSECGLCSADGNGSIDRESAAAWLELLDRKGISCVFWNLSNKNEASALLSPSCSGLSGFSEDDLSESGKLVHDYLNEQPKAAGPVSPSGKKAAAEEKLLSGSGVTAAVNLRTSWPEGSRRAELYDVTVTAGAAAVNGWAVDLPVPTDAALRDSWGGTFTLDNGILRIRSLDYNAELKTGGTAGNIGFIIIRND